MFLKPEQMLKIRIIGSNSKREEIISSLHDVGIMQLEQIDPQIAAILETGKVGQSFKVLSDHLQKFRGYQTILPNRKVADKKFFESIEELLLAAEKIEESLNEEIENLKSKEEVLTGKMREVSNNISLAEKMIEIKYDLSIFNTHYIRSFIVKSREKLDFEKLVSSQISDSFVVDLKNGYYLITIPAEKEMEFAKLCQNQDIAVTSVPKITMNVRDYYNLLKSELFEQEQALDKIKTRLNEISDQYFKNIVQIREQLEIEVKKLEVSQKLLALQQIFVLEGWIPEKYYHILSELLSKISEDKILINKVNTDEVPPTLLNNPKKFKIFEFFIRFYSLPKESEFDPTMIFALVFPFFFGLMVGDWGYGLTILLVSVWLLHRLDHPVAKSHIPKFISKFVLMIMGPNALKTLAKVLIPSSMIAIIIGLLFNEFFGFKLLPVTVFDVIDILPKLLVLAGYIGVAMVSLGLILGIILELSYHHKKGAIAKIGWLMFAWGVVMFGLTLIHHAISISSMVTLISVTLMLVGLALILVSEKAGGLMEIPSIISHILSYTRIVGILLASVILATVVDHIFLVSVAKSPLMAVVGMIILIFGQIFNLIIAIFEPGIQGARLIYVEFFSKFYKGNGKTFRPFSTPRNYTIKKFELEPLKSK